MGSTWGQFLREPLHKMVVSDKQMVMKTIAIFIVCDIILTHGSPLNSEIMDINSEPGKPYIMQAMEEEMMEVQEGEEVELQCESQGGRPPAEIQWWDEEGRRIVSDVTEHVKRMEDTKMFKTVSTLRFTPSMGQQVKCSAHNDAFPAIRQSHGIMLELLGQPQLQFEQLEDEASVKITCKDDNDNSVKKFKWSINDVELFDETENVLQIHQFSKSYDKSKVKCSVVYRDNSEKVSKIVELLHKETPKSDMFQNTHMRIVFPNVQDGKIEKKRNKMFTCVASEYEQDDQSYVGTHSELKELKDDFPIYAKNGSRHHKCKVLHKGAKKLIRMSKNMKKIAKTLRQFSKTLSVIKSSIDDT